MVNTEAKPEHVAGVPHAVARAALFAAQLLPLAALQHVSALEPHIPRRVHQPPQPHHRRHPQPPEHEGLAEADCTALTDNVFLLSFCFFLFHVPIEHILLSTSTIQ